MVQRKAGRNGVEREWTLGRYLLWCDNYYSVKIRVTAKFNVFSYIEGGL